MNFKYSLIVVVLIAVLGVFAFAQTPLSTPAPIIVNANSCSETDSGLSYYAQGTITGSFWWPGANGTNVTYSGSLTDTCISSTVLLEGVCGSSINVTGLAGALYVDCSAPNPAYGCVNGACALVGNSTSSLPDLRVTAINNVVFFAGSTNSSNSTYYPIVSFNTTITNQGTATAGASNTQIRFTRLSSPLGGSNQVIVATPSLTPGQSVTLYNSFNGFSGVYSASAIADINGQVIESTENNNNFALNITLP